MKRALNFFLMIVVISLTLPSKAPASAPVGRTLDGCVINGSLYTFYQKAASQPGPRTGTHRIQVQNFDLSPYEGKKIRLQGRLYPGDRFLPDPKSLKVLGPCDRNSRNAISGSGR